MRLCKKCNTTKPLDSFWKNSKGRSGLDWHCVDCRKKSAAQHRDRQRRGEIDHSVGRPPRPVPEGTRWCSGCQSGVPIDSFTGRERTCKDCKYHSHLMRKYGLAREEYEYLKKKQGKLCAICRRRDHRYVDHDHKTGEVRGLLCQPCNTALGAFYEDPEVFHRALEYMTSNSQIASIARNE